MVKEVASLPELFVASWVLTLHDSSDSSGLSVFISQYFVVRGVGNVLALAHVMESLRLF